jgi:hypothetical protein
MIVPVTIKRRQKRIFKNPGKGISKNPSKIIKKE